MLYSTSDKSDDKEGKMGISNNIPLIAALILGISVTFIGGRLWIRQVLIQKGCNKYAEGKITGKKLQENKEPQKKGEVPMDFYFPVYTYSVNGVDYSREAPLHKSEASANWMMGQKVMVYYDIKNPERSFIAQEKIPEYFGMLVTAIGIVITIFAPAFLNK
jgi:hypothetical protein